jgi:hypothetical protein
MNLLLLAGLLNCILIPLGFYRCWDLNGRFSFKSLPLSYATKTHTKKLFSFYVVSIGLVEIIFLYELFSMIENIPVYLTILPLTSMLALTISGAVHSTTNRLLHRSAIFYMITSFVTWSFLWHIFIYPFNSTIGALGLLLSLTVLIGCPALHLHYKNFGVSELLIAASAVTWNILMIVLGTPF